MDTIIKPMLAKTYEQRYVDKFESIYTQIKMDGCLHYDSIIELKNHGKIKIGELAKNFHLYDKDLIKSYNFKKNKIVYNKITSIFINGEDIKEKNIDWFQIETETGEILTITGNHRVWIPSLKCWRQVKDLDGSEDLLLNV